MDPLVDEIGNIDYLLAQLNSSVERGEIARLTFDQISARYLERRAELVAILAHRPEPEAPVVERQAEPVPRPIREVAPEVPVRERQPEREIPLRERQAEPVTRPTFQLEPEAAARAAVAAALTPSLIAAQLATTSSEASEEVDRVFEPGTPPGGAPWVAARSSLSLGRWIAYVGGSLVVVAAAVFGIRGLVEFPPIVSLAGLIVATITLYFDGEWARSKLSLPVLGTAMISGAAALFLLDGYAVIHWLGVSGSVPWAVVLLASSVGYWLTELRIKGGWFGVAGALAQVGFCWLLGLSMGWQTYWIVALIGVVAAIWAVASDRIDAEGPLGALWRVLGPCSMVLTALVTVAMTFLVPSAVFWSRTPWPIAAGAVSAIAASVSLERVLPARRAFGVAALIPIFLAAGALYDARVVGLVGTPGFDLLGILFLFTAVTASYSVRKGSYFFAAASYIGWMMAWTGVALQLGLSWPLMLAGTAMLGVMTLVIGLIVGKVAEGGGLPLGGNAATLWQLMGPSTSIGAALAAAPLAVAGLIRPTSAVQMLPYLLLSAWVLLMLVVENSRLPRSWTGGAVIVWSFFVTASLMLFLAPGWPVSRYGIGLILVAVLWSHARGGVERLLRVPNKVVAIFSQAMYVIVPLGALALVWSAQAERSYDYAALLAVAALAWVAEALRTRERYLFIPVPVFAIAAITTAIWTGSTPEAAAIGGAVAALAIAAASLFAKVDRTSWANAIVAASAGTASALAVLVIQSPRYLVIELLLVSVIWALFSRTIMIPEIAGVSAGFAIFAVAAALWALNLPPWITMTILTAAAAVLFMPRLVLKDSPSPAIARLTAALATAGLLSLGILDTLGLASYVHISSALGQWASLAGVGLGMALLLTGVYLIVWTIVEGAELGLYVGFWLVVLFLLVEMDAAHVRFAELYLLTVGVYFALAGMYWSSRKPERPVPAGSDLAATMLVALAPLIISLGSTTSAEIRIHGLWTVGLSILIILVGLVLRARIYLLGGIGVLAVELLWLARNLLGGLPGWSYAGMAVAVLLVSGIIYSLRAPIAALSRRGDYSSWR